MKSEPIIRRLLIAWLLLLGGALLTQAFPFPGSTRLGYWLVVAVALGSPVVALLLFWLMGQDLRRFFYRLRVLRRAAKWKRTEPPTSSWFKQEWTGHPR
jgi:hypothetical protein